MISSILVPIHTVLALSYQNGLNSLLTILKFLNLSQNQPSMYLPPAHHLVNWRLQVREGGGWTLIYLWAPRELQGANAKPSALLGSTGIPLSHLNYVYIHLPRARPLRGNQEAQPASRGSYQYGEGSARR